MLEERSFTVTFTVNEDGVRLRLADHEFVPLEEFEAVSLALTEAYEALQLAQAELEAARV